ncbi:TetR/AcrR family transcriptional regulator [Bailinhaonella thermotolerans]|uniref:TetR/AcrR family transcriptional regulator n=1 Tax=Bailinhaonella thermotolerans TaxID=1070861 RepID=A0A3A4AVG6_9ACTN|nr:TetR/AcrR family transcriptional regulator [Bailinhaonella thermotolerans]
MDHAITRATRELLAEAGYAGITVDAVAERAGIGKAAIYRRYAGKQEMVFAAAVHDMSIAPPPDQGSLRADLAALARDIAESLSAPGAPTLLGLFADVSSDEAALTRIRDTFLERERACVAEVLDRAARRGELTSHPGLTPVHALLTGPILTWLLALRHTDTGDLDTFVTTLADLLTKALTSP